MKASCGFQVYGILSPVENNTNCKEVIMCLITMKWDFLAEEFQVL
jgi:hypothetical protein